jgi:hypothetical protein
VGQQGERQCSRVEGGIPVGILAYWVLGGAVGGAALIVVVSWCMPGAMSPIAEELKAIPEVQKVYGEGYEIWFYRSPPNARYEKWVLEARKHGRGKAHLSADFIAAKQCLYIANVCVDQGHGNKGLATAMLICATRMTQCRVLTTSGRTNQGAKFFETNRLRLSQHGVELHDYVLVVERYPS